MFITKKNKNIYIYILSLDVVSRVMGINSLLNTKTPILLDNFHLTTNEENLVWIDNLNLSC
jgi:hypothetical protein